MFQIEIRKYQLALKHPFTIAHSSRTHQTILIIKIEKDGITGLGEASISSYHPVPIETLYDYFLMVKPQLEQISFEDPAQFWTSAASILESHPALQCALDIAAYDWYAKSQGKTVHEILKANPSDAVMTSYTIGIAEPEVMLEKMQAVPWPIYKIKLGTPHDLDITKNLRKHTEAIFRIDANTAWSADQTIALSHTLKDLGVEYIEQPMAANAWEEMKTVMKESALPIIADESCQVASDVQKCAGHFDGINIKLMKCGGITPGLQMIQEARSLGMQIMIGCMLESSIGIAGAAHLLPLVDYADLDSPLLITNDPAQGIMLENGKLLYSNHHGTGVALIDEGLFVNS